MPGHVQGTSVGTVAHIRLWTSQLIMHGYLEHTNKCKWVKQQMELSLVLMGLELSNLLKRSDRDNHIDIYYISETMSSHMPCDLSHFKTSFKVTEQLASLSKADEHRSEIYEYCLLKWTLNNNNNNNMGFKCIWISVLNMGVKFISKSWNM